MASVHRMRRSEYWYCSYTASSGIRTCCSTNETDHDKAMDKCVKIQAEEVKKAKKERKHG